MIKIDEINAKILRALIMDARSKLTVIANDCGISSTAVKNRIERLKKCGVIVDAALLFNMASFGYNYPAYIRVNVDINEEDKITNLVRKHAKVAGIDKTIGRYSLNLFVFAQNINKLDNLKFLIRNQKGVNDIEVNIWKNFHLNYSNIRI